MFGDSKIYYVFEIMFSYAQQGIYLIKKFSKPSKIAKWDLKYEFKICNLFL